MCVRERERERESERERGEGREREGEGGGGEREGEETRNTDLSEKLGNISVSVEPRQLCFFSHTNTYLYIHAYIHAHHKQVGM